MGYAPIKSSLVKDVDRLLESQTVGRRLNITPTIWAFGRYPGLVAHSAQQCGDEFLHIVGRQSEKTVLQKLVCSSSCVLASNFELTNSLRRQRRFFGGRNRSGAELTLQLGQDFATGLEEGKEAPQGIS